MIFCRQFAISTLAVAFVALSVGCDDSVDSTKASDAAVDVVAVETGADATPVKDGGADARTEPDAGPLPPEGPPYGPRDRAGRAYVSMLLVSAANRESYNLEPVDFALATDPPGAATSFGADFQAALVTLDALDSVNDWAGGAADAGPDDAGTFAHPLTNAWIGVDALVVDPNKPFSTTSYLEIEAIGGSHTTCGGRWFDDDALDVTASYLVKKSRTGITDGVSQPARPSAMTFPFLASPF